MKEVEGKEIQQTEARAHPALQTGKSREKKQKDGKR